MIINESVKNKYKNMITESTGVTDAVKLDWMSQMCAFHTMNESVHGYSHLNPNANVGGMGEIIMPNTDAPVVGGTSQWPQRGSGDLPSTTLPLALCIAAQTFALDLVNVVPMQTPMTLLQYMDYVYENGKLNEQPWVFGADKSMKKPRLIKATANTEATAAEVAEAIKTAFADGLKADPTKGAYSVTLSDGTVANFIGQKSFYDGKFIFEVSYEHEAYLGAGVNALGENGNKWAAYNNAKAGEAGDATLKIGEVTFTIDETSIETVKAFEDFVPMFSGNSKWAPADKNGGLVAGAMTNPYMVNPYTRGEGEMTPANMMSLNIYTESVSAKTINVGGVITREQLQDLEKYGINATESIDKALVNETTQYINRDVLSKLFELGVKGAETSGFDATIRIIENGAETTGTIQRKVMSKLLAAKNMINVRSRRGPATWVVCSGSIATALQDCAGFVAYPMANTLSVTSNALYPSGTLAGLSIYVDPLLPFESRIVMVGRKGKIDEPGLFFLPYILSDKVTYPSEGMGGANKSEMKSRYGIAAVGHHPEASYLTFELKFQKAVDGDVIADNLLY